MNSFFTKATNIPSYELKRDLVRNLKRGHRWVFAEAFDPQIKMQEGIAEIRYKKESLGVGIVQNGTQLRFRLLALTQDLGESREPLSQKFETYMQLQWKKALALRSSFDRSKTNAYRLVNGEGDGFPGLVVDLYDFVAVIKHDHASLEKIWNVKEIARQIQTACPFVKVVYLKRRDSQDSEKGECLVGELPEEIEFLENGMRFLANIREGSKTGFFLDQRDNRCLISRFSSGADVLNVFSYTGGFSVFAGLGGAKSVTSVDISRPAIANAEVNFKLNNLKGIHSGISRDAFEYLEEVAKRKACFDLVINDPPSFAPSQKTVPQARAAYEKVFTTSLKLVRVGGLFAASSCSSHISESIFFEILTESFSKARRRGTVIATGGQPSDHPWPLAMPEMRYLKFILFRVD